MYYQIKIMFPNKNIWLGGKSMGGRISAIISKEIPVKGVIVFASTIFTLGIGIGFNKPDREPEIGGIFLLASSIIHYLSTINAIKSSQKINELYYKEYLNKQNVQPTN